MELIILFVLGIAAYIGISVFNTKRRRQKLMEKYGDAVLVERIMKKMFWQGQTREQLLDSLGRPLDVGNQVLKTKTKETWKYNQLGKNRYGLRIILEDGIVVGWNQA